MCWKTNDLILGFKITSVSVSHHFKWLKYDFKGIMTVSQMGKKGIGEEKWPKS